MDKKLIIDGASNIFLELIVGNKIYSTTLSPTQDSIFFSQEIYKELSPTQMLIFNYGFKKKDNSQTISYELRKDLKANHLNFDMRINNVLMNNHTPSNAQKVKIKEFFLHIISGIPKELKINISRLNVNDSIEKATFVKSYKLNL